MGVTVDAVDSVDAVDCCFSEMDSTGATALIRPFVVFVVFVVFKVKMSSSLGATAAVCVEGGLRLTTEAQDFIECNKYNKWNAINYCF